MTALHRACLIAATLLLGACGFQLRGTASLPFTRSAPAPTA